MNALPFEPESIDSLRARFLKATEKRFYPKRYCDSDNSPEIGLSRSQVFDYDDGELSFRMIASVEVDERQAEEVTRLHCSFFFYRGEPSQLMPLALCRVGIALHVVAGPIVGESIQPDFFWPEHAPGGHTVWNIMIRWPVEAELLAGGGL